MEQDRKDSAAVQPKITWFVLFGAFTASVLVYGVVAFLVWNARGVTNPPEGVDIALLRPIFFVLGGVCLVLGVVVPKLLLKAWSKLGPNEPIGGDPRPTPGHFQTTTILSLAFGESTAIFGLVLALLGGSLGDFLLPAAATLAFFFSYVLPQGVRYWSGAQGPTL
ncbi:MAG: hypothetical protein HYZ53_08795 [Planctomycetes bacterium]|nr:hypothetical protein [Planctomycetota bacterium]